MKKISLNAAIDLVLAHGHDLKTVEVVLIGATERPVSPLESAIALQLTTGTPYGIGHKIGELAGEVRKYLGNTLLTTSEIKQVLKEWMNYGLVVIKNNYVQVADAAHQVLHMISVSRGTAAA